MEVLKCFEHNVNLILEIFLLSGVLYQTIIGQEIRDRQMPMVNADPVPDLNFAPYMVALYIYNNNSYHFTCGGTIVSETHVLTAAHCVMGKAAYKIIVGSLDLQSEIGQDYFISDIIKHPKFQFLSFMDPPVNDIAVLQVETPIEFKEYAQPLSLPEKDVESDGFFALALGYGQTQNALEKSGILRYAYIKVLSEEECQVKNPETASTKICTYVDKNEVDTCAGDSGGPLVYNNTIIGVLSNGPSPCAQVGTTVTYTKVSAYRDWIKEHIGL